MMGAFTLGLATWAAATCTTGAAIDRGGLVPLYFGRRHVGRISGAMSTIVLMSRAAAPLAAAWVLLALPGYREVLLVLAALGAVALGAFALARPPGTSGPVAKV